MTQQSLHKHEAEFSQQWQYFTFSVRGTTVNKPFLVVHGVD